MNFDLNMTIWVVIKGLTLLFMSLSFVYTAGIVWRVEKRLDTVYKMFLLAITFFLLEELAGFFEVAGKEYLQLFSKFIFAAFFLGGILEMRKLIRKMDGEL